MHIARIFCGDGKEPGGRKIHLYRSAGGRSRASYGGAGAKNRIFIKIIRRSDGTVTILLAKGQEEPLGSRPMAPNLTEKPKLLWFDLTHDRSTKELLSQFQDTCDCTLAKNAMLPSGEQVDMICIHFDRPDTPGLRRLLEIKRTVPATPITMFTVQHSEELAVWAMRSSVWEYMVVP